MTTGQIFARTPRDPAPTLVYVTYTQPGISRVRTGQTFRYLDSDGSEIHSLEILSRIARLALPPAWTDVWICALHNGHLQAVGRDARGRRQYRYHPLFNAHHAAAKFDELLELARVLPALRRRVDQDLTLPGLPRAKVLATVIRLLELTLIRVGNEQYAHDNQSYGLTTFEDRHAVIDADQIRFTFRGKSGKDHVVDARDPLLAQIVKQCQDLPGRELFAYLDLSGHRRDIASEDVNAYLHTGGSPRFTAKDFRTWMATVLSIDILRNSPPPTSTAQAKQTIIRCLQTVARALGNTPAVCRKAYVHPAALEKYASGELPQLCTSQADSIPLGLSLPERATVAFLRNLSNTPAPSANPKRKKR